MKRPLLLFAYKTVNVVYAGALLVCFVAFTRNPDDAQQRFLLRLAPVVLTSLVLLTNYFVGKRYAVTTGQPVTTVDGRRIWVIFLAVYLVFILLFQLFSFHLNSY